MVLDKKTTRYRIEGVGSARSEGEVSVDAKPYLEQGRGGEGWFNGCHLLNNFCEARARDVSSSSM